MTGPHDPYADPARLEDAVGRLTDPLNDPLPNQQNGNGQHSVQDDQHHQNGQHGQHGSAVSGQGSPWFRPHHQTPANGDHLTPDGPDAPYQPSTYDPPHTYGQETYEPPAQGGVDGYEAHDRTATPAAEPTESPPSPSEEQARRGPDNETVALRQAKETRRSRRAGGADETAAAKDSAPPTSGGRAARRKAGAQTAANGRAARRKAAAQAAKAHRSGLGMMASRAIGELFITTGVLLLLFVTYQLWWTNIQANQHANGEANNLERAFDEGGGSDAKEPEKFEAGEGFAIMYIPKLDVRVPVAEGTEKGGVLDRGMAGHYDKKSGLETAMPWDKQGNFAVAGHRNTHGEPFRYINKLDPDDEIIVETRSKYYTYKVANRLASTSPGNTDVINPVPKQSGFTKPGRYLTLTTCTPEFSSKYRLIVWGTMVDERPRSEGKPDALGG